MLNPVNTPLSSEDPRCAVCGDPIQGSEPLYRVTDGAVREGKWAEGAEWGVMHKACFALATQSPDAILAELQRQSAS